MNEKALTQISRANARKFSKAVPPVLDEIADVVLAYRPKPKSKAAQKRKRKAARKAKG